MYNNISLCFILLFGGSMIRSVDPQHTTKELAIMKAFMDKDFLLETPTAQHLYHDYAETLPIVDYHCHIPPQEIYEKRRFGWAAIRFWPMALTTTSATIISGA